MKDNRKILQVLVILTILFTVMGGSLAYWNWQSETVTGVTFTVGRNFSCSVDGGQNISSNEVSLAPASCTSELYAMKKELKVMPRISINDLAISMDLWLTVDHMDSGLYNSENFKYALTRSPNSCTSGVLSSGTFKGINNKEKVNILNGRIYNTFGSSTETLYLYIWLDKEESSRDTMDQTFQFTLGGECHDDEFVHEKPVLDDAMVPVTIANNGDVTTVSETDPAWYDYENKEWANIVLVKEEGTNTREYYLNNPNQPVEEEDILAYYVWIPRYKYRIPGNSCGSISESERNIEDYPECYDGPFSMSDSDMEKFEDFLYALYGSDGHSSYVVLNNSITDIMDTGILELYDEAMQEDCSQTLIEVVERYNLIENGEFCETYCITKESDITSLSGTFDEDRILSGPSSINISFEPASSSYEYGDAVNTYRSHPGFWWDDNENNTIDSGELISGLWVGKFEMPLSTTYDENDEKVYLNDRILPGVAGVVDLDVQNAFTYVMLKDAKKFTSSENVYGLSDDKLDSHPLKNSEWGAVAYLSHSKYGINTNIEENQTDITGGGTYGNLSSYPQSTTGNISGIFDMNGRNPEHLMFTACNDEDEYYYGYLNKGKYYDVFSDFQFNFLTNNAYGHAFSETYNWYGSQFEKSYFDCEDDGIFRCDLFGICNAPGWCSTQGLCLGGGAWHGALIN